MESHIFSYEPNPYKEGAVLLAAIDESESYEVDITEIYKVGDEFHLLTASGCSCWSGEYEERIFSSLEDLESHVISSLEADKYQYNPSPAGLVDLMAQVEVSLNG